MNSITRLTANIFFAIIISVVFADIAYYGFGFIRSSPMNAAMVVFAACFASSLLICELFSVSKESNKIKNKVKKSRLSKIAKRIAIENARYNRRIRNASPPRISAGAAGDDNPNQNQDQTTCGIRTPANAESPAVAEEDQQKVADPAKAANRITEPAQESSAPDGQATAKKTQNGRGDGESGKKQEAGNRNEKTGEGAEAEAGANAEPEVNLYIGNLSFSIQSAEIEKLLEPYGKTIKINIMHNRKGKKKKAYAYVRMSKSCAEKAAAELNNARFQERAIMVKVSYGG